MKKTFIFILLVFILFSYPALKSFLGPGLFDSHDGKFHILRIYFMNKELRNGQFPVRWVGDFNFRFGYPTFNFFYPGPYYLAQPFLFLGFNSIAAYKIIIISTFIFSAIFMFLWARNYWGNFGAFVSAVLYLYAPYRFVSLYVNGTFAVAVAFAVVPLVFLFTYLLFTKKSLRYLALTSISLGLLLITHNPTVIIFSPIIASYFLYLIITSKNKKTAVFSTLTSIVFALGLASFFILPMIIELPAVRTKNIAAAVTYQEHFPKLRQLIYSPWGYGYSVTGPADGMSFQLGIAQWVIILLLSFLLIFNLKKKIKERKLILLFITNFWLIFFLMNEKSNFIWEKIEIIQRVQFPWKFLSVEIFIVAFLGGSFVNIFKDKVVTCSLLVFLMILAFYGNRNHSRPATFDRFSEKYFLHGVGTADISSELMPIWANFTPPFHNAGKLWIIRGKGTLEKIKVNSVFYEYKSLIEKPSKILVGSIYFPGWQVYIDSQKANFNIEKGYGIFSFKVSPGSHIIKVKLENTFIRTLGNILSLASILIIILMSIKNGKIFK